MKLNIQEVTALDYASGQCTSIDIMLVANAQA